MMREKGQGLAKLIPDGRFQDSLDDEPILDRAIQSRIGDNLRRMYDDLMNQPVPDRFSELINRLERKDGEDTR